MFEYAAFEDFDLLTMPSTAKTVKDTNSNAASARAL
jgi:hypothetical protein